MLRATCHPQLFRFSLFPLLLLVACGSRMPEKRPSDFYLHYSDGGGMMPYGVGLTVDGQTATQEIFNEGVTVQITYQLTADEADTLYQTLVENRLDRIQTYDEEEVYDRGGTSVSVTADGETFQVSDTGLTFVKNSWQAEYGGVLDGIAQVMERTYGTVATQFVITWDDSFSMSGRTLHIYMDGDFASLTSEAGSNQASIVTNNINGRYLVEIGNNSSETVTSTTLDLTTSMVYQLVRQDGIITLIPMP